MKTKEKIKRVMENPDLSDEEKEDLIKSIKIEDFIDKFWFAYGLFVGFTISYMRNHFDQK